jgi:hypothetical protein
MNPHIQLDTMPRKANLPEVVPQIVHIFASCEDASDSQFSCLPERLEATQVEAFLHELTQAVEHAASCASEAELKCFVQWALEQSYSDELNYLERMQLLELAWRIQKLLWATEKA